MKFKVRMPTLEADDDLEAMEVLSVSMTEMDVFQSVKAVHFDAVAIPHQFGEESIGLVIFSCPAALGTTLPAPPVLIVEAVPENSTDRKQIRRRKPVFTLALWQRSLPPEPDSLAFARNVVMRTPISIGEVSTILRAGTWRGQQALWLKPEGFEEEAMLVLDDTTAAELRAFLDGRHRGGQVVLRKHLKFGERFQYLGIHVGTAMALLIAVGAGEDASYDLQDDGNDLRVHPGAADLPVYVVDVGPQTAATCEDNYCRHRPCPPGCTDPLHLHAAAARRLPYQIDHVAGSGS